MTSAQERVVEIAKCADNPNRWLFPEEWAVVVRLLQLVGNPSDDQVDVLADRVGSWGGQVRRNLEKIAAMVVAEPPSVLVEVPIAEDAS